MKNLSVQQLLALITTFTVLSYVGLPRPAAAAEAHVVSLAELQQDLHRLQQERAENFADIERVLSLPAAQETLATSHLDPSRIMPAIAELDDDELSQLADQARAAEKDVEGGLIVGMLALIGLIVVVAVILTVIKKND